MGNTGHSLYGEYISLASHSLEPGVESIQVAPRGHRESFRWTV
jgi:hypothetical protein